MPHIKEPALKMSAKYEIPPCFNVVGGTTVTSIATQSVFWHHTITGEILLFVVLQPHLCFSIYVVFMTFI